MKKLLLIFTFLLVFPLKAFASCEDIHRNPLSNGTLFVHYINYGGSSGSVSNANGSVLTSTNIESISDVTKDVYTTFDSDYLILQGSLEFLVYGNDPSQNPNTPVVNNISAPIIYPVNDSSSESYCEVLGFNSVYSGPNYIGEYMVDNLLTPKLNSYSLTLKCHRNSNFPTTRVTYRLLFYLQFNSFYNDSFTLNSQYRVNATFRNYGISVNNTCTNEQIIETIDSINDSITDLNDSITDTSISNSQTELEDQLDDWGVNYHGVAGFVTAPLSFISSLANQQACSPIPLPPILGNTSSTFVLPCFMEEFEDRFPSLFAIYQIAIYFFVCYRIGIDCFKLIQKLKDPLNDEISVADI